MTEQKKLVFETGTGKVSLKALGSYMHHCLITLIWYLSAFTEKSVKDFLLR